MIGLVQTLDGAGEELGNVLQRMRVLAVQSANDTQSTDSRSYIQKEVDALYEEYGEIVTTTKFNGKNLISNSADQTFLAHVGAYSGETIGVYSQWIGTVWPHDVTTQTAAESFITQVDTYLRETNNRRATYGATQNRLESIVRNISVTQVNVKASESAIRDVDFASESADFSKHNIITQSGSYALSQANATNNNIMALFQ